MGSKQQPGSIMSNFLFLVLGFLLLIYGSDGSVDGASSSLDQ